MLHCCSYRCDPLPELPNPLIDVHNSKIKVLGMLSNDIRIQVKNKLSGKYHHYKMTNTWKLASLF